MPVVIALAAVAVLAAVVVLAMGHGGELAEARLDRPPALLPWNRPIEATDIALLRLPPGMYGYHIGTTDEVLTELARTLGERSSRIAVLEQQVGELRSRLEGHDQTAGPQASWEPARPQEPEPPRLPRRPRPSPQPQSSQPQNLQPRNAQPQNPWSPPDSAPPADSLQLDSWAGSPTVDAPPADAPRADNVPLPGPPAQWGSQGPGQVVFGPYDMSDHSMPDRQKPDQPGGDR